MEVKERNWKKHVNGNKREERERNGKKQEGRERNREETGRNRKKQEKIDKKGRSKKNILNVHFFNCFSHCAMAGHGSLAINILLSKHSIHSVRFALFLVQPVAYRACSLTTQQHWLTGAQSDEDAHFGGQHYHKSTKRKVMVVIYNQ